LAFAFAKPNVLDRAVGFVCCPTVGGMVSCRFRSTSLSSHNKVWSEPQPL